MSLKGSHVQQVKNQKQLNVALPGFIPIEPLGSVHGVPSSLGITSLLSLCCFFEFPNNGKSANKRSCIEIVASWACVLFFGVRNCELSQNMSI
jgi:hypothetical protein